MSTPQGPGQQPPYPPQGGGYPPQGGYPAPGGYPPPAAPEKKSRKGLIIGIIVAIIALCGIGVAVSGGGDKSDKSSTPTANAPAGGGETQAEEKHDDGDAKLNQPVRDGKFEFVVTNVDTGQTSVGESILEQKAQGQFAIVSVTVKNIGDKKQSFDPSSQKLVDQQGREHGTDTTAQLALGGSDIPIWDDINPGNEVNVKLVFDIPKNAVPSALELHDSMFSNGSKVSLK
ncbi:DUF4352 domain-containing protein [Gordonia sp. (in: high G+C Gram-positive bacteria)]|uniref:DUF4352 domain-containing protein n=1 Tax=Gordonia sp. (in: high G+C Gram-positive bacteria) TaxID=84139 RepID=UPI0039E5653A